MTLMTVRSSEERAGGDGGGSVKAIQKGNQ